MDILVSQDDPVERGKPNAETHHSSNRDGRTSGAISADFRTRVVISMETVIGGSNGGNGNNGRIRQLGFSSGASGCASRALSKDRATVGCNCAAMGGRRRGSIFIRLDGEGGLSARHGAPHAVVHRSNGLSGAGASRAAGIWRGARAPRSRPTELDIPASNSGVSKDERYLTRRCYPTAASGQIKNDVPSEHGARLAGSGCDTPLAAPAAVDVVIPQGYA